MEALACGWTHYGDLNGDPELRTLAARLASDAAGVVYRPEQDDGRGGQRGLAARGDRRAH
jgi:hypothetical protein